jgi:hypothetical protein
MNTTIDWRKIESMSSRFPHDTARMLLYNVIVHGPDPDRWPTYGWDWIEGQYVVEEGSV